MKPLKNASSNDYVSCSIDSANLAYPIWISPCLVGHVKSHDFLNSIFTVSQSATGQQAFLLDGLLNVTFTITKSLRGGGKTKLPQTAMQHSRDKKSVIQITGKDDNCLIRSFAVAIFIAINGKKHKEYKNLIKPNRPLQLKKAKEFAALCNLPCNTPLSRQHLDQIDDKIGQVFRFIVYNAMTNKPEYANTPLATQLYTLFFEYLDGQSTGHYNVINNIKGYLNTRHYCATCLIGYRDRHLCASTCFICGSRPICTGTPITTCDDCGRDFNGFICYSNHLTNKICRKYKKCLICHRDYSGYAVHKCMSYRCGQCYENYDQQPHYCYIAPLNHAKIKKEDAIKKYFVFFDCEATQEIEVNNKLYHRPNLVVCRINCDHCFDLSSNLVNDCSICKRQVVFWGDACIDEFVSFVLNTFASQVKTSRVVVFSHNSQGYDGQFILRSLWQLNFLDIKVICVGHKLLKITVGNVVFIDSLSFFLLPLSALPAAFDLPTVLKGNFPHKFNCKSNSNYKGPWPDLFYYAPEYLKPSELNKLTEWHSKQKYKVFDFKKELLKYCVDDVKILQQAIMNFRYLF